MNDWKKLFTKTILERGMGYYQNGAVEIKSADDRLIEAEVEGSETYNVSIWLEDGAVDDMSCDCPYADDGNNCKHMAAVLFAAEKLKLNSGDGNAWEKALDKLTDSELRGFVREIAKSDPKVREKLLCTASPGAFNIAAIGREVEKLIDRYADMSGYLESDDECDCAAELAEYLNGKFDETFGKITMAESAGIVLTVLEAALDIDCDDSEDDLTLVVEACENCFERVISGMTGDEQRLVFDRLIKDIDANDLRNAGYLPELVCSLGWNRELTKKLMERLDKGSRGDDITTRVRLMERLGTDRAEIIGYLEKQGESDEAFSLLLGIYEKTDIKKAVGLIKRRLENGDLSQYEKAVLTNKLIALYEKLGDRENCRAGLCRLIFDLKRYDIEDVKRLRAVTDPDEWASDTFFRVLNQSESRTQRLSLYSLEGMYDSMLMEFREGGEPGDSGEFRDFEEYESLLAEKFPERARDIRARLTDQSMARSGHREEYREVIAGLDKLRGYPDGEESARELAAKWRAGYPARRAMIDELGKAGY